MSLYFITGNSEKFKEVEKLLPDISQLNIDLPEIQELDPQKVIKAKLIEAYNHHKGSFIVEDTSLYIKGLNGLPGPLIKWFLQTIGTDGLHKLTACLDNNKATAKTCIAYARSVEDIYFFEGTVEGHIVKPRGINGFGWDDIFQPIGQNKTFAEMNSDEKIKFSMRRNTVERLVDFINK